MPTIKLTAAKINEFKFVKDLYVTQSVYTGAACAISTRMGMCGLTSGFDGGLNRTPNEPLRKPFSLPILACRTLGSRHRASGNRMS
jgi:hypothetical protein